MSAEGTVNAVALTEDQQRFLDQCEVDFSARYTDADADFTAVRDETSKTPPVVDPWYNKPRRNFDWTDRRGGRRGGGGGDNDRGYQQHRQGYQHHRQGDRYYQRHRPY